MAREHRAGLLVKTVQRRVSRPAGRLASRDRRRASTRRRRSDWPCAAARQLEAPATRALLERYGGGAEPRPAEQRDAVGSVSAPYVGRFAPSPSGPLHVGSLVAALASWLDARAHGGCWLVRIEDLDTPRNVAGGAEAIVAQLALSGLVPDGPVVHQSTRTARYEAALQRLLASEHAFACACSRRDLALAGAAPASAGDPVDGADGDDAGGERVYPGTCRAGLGGKAARSIRLRVRADGDPDDAAVIAWHDRRLGAQRQDLARAVGDFVLKRADGIFAYQLAVVVDDAEQGVSDVVRGEDLADSTARQILLQRRLGLATPRYLHTPLVRNADGTKLSKQTGAAPLSLAAPLADLRQAGAVLGLAAQGTTVAEWLAAAVACWRERWGGA
jgi:glutamyl-Q tRNA(Asp) synthetase